MEVDEEFFVADDLSLPGCAIDLLELVEGGAELGFGEVESGPLDVVEVGGPADRRLPGAHPAMDAVDDPLEDAHVLCVAGPEEAAVLVLAEPVDVEDARGDGERALHFDPVAEVVSHVVAAEGQHGHGVAADPACGRAGCGGGLRAHGCAGVDAGGPVEGLVDERDGGGAAASEDDGGDRDSVGVLPVGIDRGALRGGRGEAAIGMGCGVLLAGVH